MSRPARELSWVTDGQRVFEQTRQVEGLCRPLTWAQTGIETPMLPGGELIAFRPEPSAPEPVTGAVTGPVQHLADWLTGRPHGKTLTAPDGRPELPPWM